jgi:hypothetical protein
MAAILRPGKAIQVSFRTANGSAGERWTCPASSRSEAFSPSSCASCDRLRPTADNGGDAAAS